VGTGVRDGDLQRPKANPPRNLHLNHYKPQPRPAWDRWLSRGGEIKPARGRCLRLGRGRWLPKNQKRLEHRKGRGLAAAHWESDWFAFNCTNPDLGKFYRPRLGIPPAPPFFTPEHRNALSPARRCRDGAQRPRGGDVGGEPSTHPAPLLLLSERCSAAARTAGRWENRGSPAGKTRSRCPGKATCSLTPRFPGISPSGHRLPAASLLLRAPRGPPPRNPPAEPKPREINGLFFF